MKRSRSIRFPEPDFLPKERGAFQERYVREVFFLCLLGATDVQIAQTFGVHVKTIELWKRTRPEFLKSMNAGKIDADAKVSHSLFLAAVGYSHADQVIIPNKRKKYDSNGRIVEEWTEPLIVETVKNYPPNVTAALKWLQARQPEVWGNKLHVKGRVDHMHKLDLTNFSESELSVLKKLGMGSFPIEDTDYSEEV